MTHMEYPVNHCQICYFMHFLLLCGKPIKGRATSCIILFPVAITHNALQLVAFKQILITLKLGFKRIFILI